MSILIKGLKKPKTCARFEDGEFVRCPFVNTDDDCILQDKITDTWEEMYKNCPLIELPEKHGRLIDERVAYDKIAEQEGGYYMDMDGVDMGLQETPTIIEAEGDEE